MFFEKNNLVFNFNNGKYHKRTIRENKIKSFRFL